MAINNTVMIKIVELLKSASEGAEYALHSFKAGEDSTFAMLLSNVETVIIKVSETLIPFKDDLTCSQCFNIIENINNSIGNMADKINGGDRRRGEIILEFEIIPLLAELKEDLYFFTLIYPDKNKMDAYYKNEFAKNHENKYVAQDKTRFEVSIIVIAWNKLDYTKKCIDSLFKYTDLKGLNCELITVNHGSEDGTEAYFESLPHEKKINFKKNMCAIITPFCTRIVEGKYFVLVNNDVILTTSWLENMLACIKSDKTIAYVGPTTSNISNRQSIPTSYTNMDELQQFAKGYNISNPDLWEDRVKLCPPVCIMSMEILNKTGFSDRYYRFMEFSDDDASTLFRRKGYRQILLRDTFCHHFGSITLGGAQKKNNTLGTSRQLFINKHGFDPWGNGFCYDEFVINSLSYDIQGHVNILGIDAGLGSTPLQIKNELRHKGNNDVSLYNFTTEEQFTPDLKPCSDYFALDNIENLKKTFSEEKFDYICLCKNLEYYTEFKKLIDMLMNRLKQDGQLIFVISNIFNINNIQNVAHLLFPGDDENINWLNPQKVLKYLNAEFPKCKVYLIQQEIAAQQQQLFEILLKVNGQNSKISSFLKTTHFQFIVKR